MSLESKRMLAFLLCGLILMFWLSTRQKAARVAAAKQALVEQIKPAPALEEGLKQGGIPSSSALVAAGKPAYPAVEIRQYQLENSDLALTFTNEGGYLREVWLKNYSKVRQAKGSDGRFTNEQAIKLHDFSMPGDLQWSFRVDGVIVDDQLTVPTLQPASGSGSELVFTYPPVQGLTIKKVFRIDPSGYRLQHELLVKNSGDRLVLMAPQTSIAGSLTAAKKGLFSNGDSLEGVAFINDKTAKTVLEKLKNKSEGGLPESHAGSVVSFGGIMDRYFAKALLPERGMAQAVNFERTGEVARVGISYPERKLAAGEEERFALSYFLGPKDLSVLGAVNEKLERTIDLGDWVGWIARPMLKFLRFIHSYVGNYGWAIILLTLLVRLMLYPLTHIQYKSMKKMQKLKPHMDELKAKYKDNKEEMNRQMVQLFRTQKVNPMGGCLPLVVQMPVFFALYRVLLNAIELRHAPFFGWLTDLSVKDPYYITPVLMGVTMFIQQRMTPTTGMDPTQEAMMKYMPIIFSLFMLTLPSGLVVYILVSTLFGIIQQWMINRPAGNQQPSAAANAANR